MPSIALLLQASAAACATVAAAAPAEAVAASTSWFPNTTVACGAIQGVWDPAHEGVAAFLGIPFAAPPVGPLRWRPPAEAACWPRGSTFAAQTAPPACPQLRQSPSVPEAESCLFLNVFSKWTTSQQPQDAANHNNTRNDTNHTTSHAWQQQNNSNNSKPVLVWLYGGGNVDGSTTAYGDIQSIVPSLDGDVLLVALQFRLNSFGFLALRELSATDPRGNASGNYAILDIQQGLRWVRDNIASFGGDPNRVTVFGQSSGGTNVLALLASPASNGLFQAAMSLSGSPNISMPLGSLEAQGRQLVEAVGCDKAAGGGGDGGDGADGNDVLECMYALPYPVLQAATPEHWAYSGDFDKDTRHPRGVPYPGLVGVDGVTIPKPLEQAYAAAVVDVPVVFATMQAEQDVSAEEMSWANASDFDGYCAAQFAAPWKHGTAGSVEALYSDVARQNASFAYASLSSDVGVSCGNARLAVIAGQAFKSPVYVAVSTHWPSQCLRGSCFPYHTWDTTAAFGTFASAGLETPSPADLAFGASVRSVWRGIAVDGQLPAALPPVSATPGFPASYSTVRVDTNVTAAANLKTAQCAGLEGAGLGHQFWWVN